ncbi:ATP phosphoribosyltransferase [Candidatus Vidania fulgoroideorum]
MNILIPKGRILNYFSSFLKKKKIFINSKSRKTILKTNFEALKIIPVKCSDINYYLKKDFVDCCVLGNDILIKKKFKKIFYKKKINIFKCGLFLITRNKYNLINNYFLGKNIKIFTKYKKITQKYFKTKKYSYKKFNGSLETLLCLKLTDYITDIVDTGKTLKENNLLKIEKIKSIYSIILIKKNLKNYFKKLLKKILK